MYWDPIMIFLMLYIAFFLPYKLTFWENDPTSIVIIDYLIDLFFLVDIFVNFLTSYTDSELNVTVKSPKKIAMQYLKGWFIFDAVAVLPVDFFVYLAMGSSADAGNLGSLKLARLVRLYRLYRLVRLLKMARVGRLSGTFSEFVESFSSLDSNAIRLVKFGLVGAFLCHVLACVWFYISKFYNLVPETWVYRYGYVDDPPYDQYIKSLYWSV